jgi:hypothetical protein
MHLPPDDGNQTFNLFLKRMWTTSLVPRSGGWHFDTGDGLGYFVDSAHCEEQTVRKSSKELRTAKLLTQGLWELRGGGIWRNVRE